MLTVFPETVSLIKPIKGSFHNPVFWQGNEHMQFIAFDNFNTGVAKLYDSIGEIVTRIAAVDRKFSTQDRLPRCSIVI